MYPDLEGKTALITGSGKKSGIGYCIAKKLATCGANVIISDLGRTANSGYEVETGSLGQMEDIARDLHEEFNVRTQVVAADVRSTASVADMVETIRQQFHHVHILCNNAGAAFGVPSAIHTYDEAAWMKTIDVNLHSVYRISQAIIPFMTDTGGSIINTASRAGKAPYLFNGAYATAKAGVIMMSKIMALELANEGIRVNAICPGQIMTDMEKWRFGLEAKFLDTTVEARIEEMRKTIPLGHIGSPEEVANLVAFLASSESSYITGQAINVCGGQLMEL